MVQPDSVSVTWGFFQQSRSKPMPMQEPNAVVRTPNGNDYGKDLLKEHLEAAHAQRKD